MSPEDTFAAAEADDVSDPEKEKQLAPDDPSGGTKLVTSTRTAARTERVERREAVRLAVREECYSGFIIVRLTDKLARRDEGCGCDGPERGSGPPGGEVFPRLWEKFPELCRHEPPSEPCDDADACGQDPALACLKELVRRCPPARLVRVVPPAAIRLIEELAAREGPAPLHSLALYWRIDARHLPARVVRALVRLLNEFPEVDLAYRELAAFDPADGKTSSFEDLQLYRESAPLGVDARWAWARAAEAAGAAPSIVLADLEQGWIAHEDLPEAAPVYGANRHGRDGYRGDHGTAVLGELAAAPDGRGVVGMVPGSKVLLLSHFQEGAGQAAPSNGHVADAAVAALLELSFEPGIARRLKSGDVAGLELSGDHLRSRGDVLLIEVQRSFKPAEVDHADFDALRLASSLGVIVVEAAGNGRTDLDAYADETGRRILAREDPELRDSGAVLVGAAESALPHNRAASSNFGSRIDCFAWGDGVVTCGYGDLFDGKPGRDGKRRSYTRDFEGTSAAAPIVAGAAALLQWLHERAGARLAPAEMRRALANPATGTLQGREAPGEIGVMPDLRAIVRALGLLPVFSAVGEALDDEADPDLGSSRVKVTTRNGRASLELTNRGLPLTKRAVGHNLEVDFYVSELATMPTPDMWEKLTSPLAFSEDLPTGMPVSLPIDKKDLRVPVRPEDFRSFLALPRLPGEVGRALPPAWPYFDWEAFAAFQRKHRSGITLAHELADPRPGEVELPFLVTGASDGPRVFDFEILQKLPLGAEVSLRVPVALAAELVQHAFRRDEDRFILPTRYRVSWPGVRLAAAGNWADPERKGVGRHACAFVVRGPRPGCAIAIRQLFRGAELGRIDWEFH